MTKQRRTPLKRITLLMLTGLFLVTGIVGVFPSPKAEAWSVDAPDAGWLRLRIGKDGRSDTMPLKAYYRVQYKNPTVRFYRPKKTLDEGSCEGSSKANIEVNKQKWACNSISEGSYKQVTLPTPKPLPGLGDGHWFVSDATVRFVDIRNTNGCETKETSNKGCIDYKFTVHLNNGSDSRIGVDASQNRNGFNLWGATSYSIPFGLSPDACGGPNQRGKIGLYDPDHDDVQLRLYDSTIGDNISDKVETPIKGQGGSIKGKGGSDPYILINNGSGDAWTYYKFKPGHRYKITVRHISDGNTVVPYWPFGTIYGEVTTSCSTVELTSASTATPEVEYNPYTNQSGTATWTHTAQNNGTADIPGVNLSYHWSSGAQPSQPHSDPPIASTGNFTLKHGASNKVTKSSSFSNFTMADVGKQFCQYVESNKTSDKDSTHLKSTPACVKVVLPTDKPYLSVYGGDVIAGRSPATDLTSCLAGNVAANVVGWNRDGSGGSYAGAGSQAAVFAPGNIQHFSSGLNITNLNPTGLAFGNTSTNVPSGTYGGGFGGKPPVGCDVSAGTVTHDVPTVSAQTLNAGDSQYYKVSGDVYVDGNILYTTTGWTKIKEVPSFKLVVTGGNIYIDNDVTELDGLYVAIPKSNGTKGEIYTCATGAGTAANRGSAGFDGTCNHKLTVYGAFAAKQVHFDRTWGTVDQATSHDTYSTSNCNNAALPPCGPAEEFVYGPEMWLPNGSGNSFEILSYQGLPPVL